MTILITGATGFIGKYLCLTLLQQGHDVKALTRSKSSLTQLTGFLEQQGVAMERFSALEGKTWNPPALSGSRLLVRNNREAASYELPLERP